MTTDALLLVAITVPLVGTLAVLVLAAHPRTRDAAALISAAITLGVCIAILTGLEGGPWLALTLAPLFPGTPIRLVGEPIGAAGATLIAVSWLVIVALVAGGATVFRPQRVTRFLGCGSTGVAAAIGVVLAGNLLSQISFDAALVVSVGLMLAPPSEEQAAAEARPILLALVGALFLTTVGAAWTFVVAKSVDFRPGGSFDAATDPEIAGLILAVFALAGTRFAILPGHRSILSLAACATPARMFVLAIVVLTAGGIPLAKVASYLIGPVVTKVIGGGDAVATVAALALAIIAFRLRGSALVVRPLAVGAAQTIAVAMALFAASEASALAALLLLMAGVLAVVALIPTLDAELGPDLDRIRGGGLRVPWLGAALLVLSASLMALPPGFGFVGVWYGLFAATPTSTLGPLVLVAVLGLAGVALLPVCERLWFARPEVSEVRAQSAADWRTLAPIGLAVLVVIVAPLVVDETLSIMAGVFGEGR
jgi:multicomponent Na+:H+ antiporter subunit D